MKNYYLVSFKYSESVFCSNLATAETAEDVKSYYSKKYDWVAVKDASPCDVESAKRKGMPVTDVPHRDKLGTLALYINTLYFDIDPYNGMTEEEGMESIVNTIVEDKDSLIDELQSIIDDEDLAEFKERAENLKARVIRFCLG